MGSGSMVGGGVGSEAPLDRQKFSNSKVYTRKLFRGPKKLPESDTVLASDSTSTSFTVVDKDAANHLKVDDIRNLSEAELGTRGSSVAKSSLNSPLQLDKPDTVLKVSDKVAESQDCISEGHADHLESKSPPRMVADCNPSTFEEAPALETTGPIEKDCAEGSQNETIADTQSYRMNGRDSELPSCATTYMNTNGVHEDCLPDKAEKQAQEARDEAVVNPDTGLQHPATIREFPPDDSTSLNRQAEMTLGAIDVERNGDLDQGKKASMASMKQEQIERRRKLESELAVIRSLVMRIEAKQGEVGYGGLRGLRLSTNDNSEGGRRLSSEVGIISVPRGFATPILTPTPRQSRPLSHLSISVMENGLGIGEGLEKEKRTPKANQFYRNSEFLLAKDKIPPAESNKKSKSSGKRHGREAVHGFGPNSKLFKSCSGLLERLMKHKHGWVFNNPVDVDGLRLHDYYTIIKCPMDLGTIKSRLGKNWYKAPEEFAEDVRLTFRNAMTYNPEGQDVHVMAKQLLDIFEDKWESIRLEYDRDMRFSTMYHMGFATPQARKAPPLPVAPFDSRRMLSRSESMPYSSSTARPKIVTAPTRTPAPKKPKAKDLNKRDMTYEEKQKLSTNLQGLPSEKLDNIVQIIKKRNSSLSQHDDEIEVDIDSVDTETLWELDRFVTNYKKSLSKNKRKAELAMQARAAVEQNAQEKVTPSVAEAVDARNSNTENRTAPTSSPLQEGKEADNNSKTSSSSSSSSDSGSSTSDSDSDSSSASGSDVGH